MRAMGPFVVVWLLLLLLARGFADSVSVLFPDGKAPDGTRYKKAYKCEGDQITIQCQPHERIHVIRANYGRFSIAICNKHGATDWSVNCMSSQTTGILQNKCDGLSHCTMPVNSHVFGEPCAGTRKYVEVHYACTTSVSSAGTTPKLPPWLLERGVGNLWQDKEEDEEGDEGVNPVSHFHGKRKPILVQSTTPLRIPITTPKPTTPNLFTTTTVSTTSITSTFTRTSKSTPVRVNELAHVDQLEIVAPAKDLVHGCSATVSRFLRWNSTDEGEISIQPCPEGTTGLARWTCGPDRVRISVQPDMSDCKSLAMSDLESSVRNEEPETVIASRLSILTEPDKRFFGGDLETAISVMRSVSNRLQYLMQHKNDFYNRASFVSDVFQNIFRSASNLMSDVVIWKDLSENSRKRGVASDLMSVLEEHAFLLSDTMDEIESIYESTANAVMAVSVSDENRQTFPMKTYTISQGRPAWLGNDSISVVRESAVPLRKKMVFFSYANLHKILSNEDDNNQVEEEKEINSRIISATLKQFLRSDNNDDDNDDHDFSVSVRLNHLSPNFSRPTCVHWDYEISGWSSRGCRVISTASSSTQCQCNRIGHFALLMSKISNQDDGGASLLHPTNDLSDLITLEIATYIVSTVCFLILLLIIIQFRRQIRKLLKKNCCCHCSSHPEAQDKEIYTGSTLMEPAASQADNRVGIIHHRYNTSSPVTLTPNYHHQQQHHDVLYAVANNRVVIANAPVYGGTPMMQYNNIRLNNTLAPLHQQPLQPPQQSPHKNSNHQSRREDYNKIPVMMMSEDREYAYHSESSSSGVSGSSSSSAHHGDQRTALHPPSYYPGQQATVHHSQPLRNSSIPPEAQKQQRQVTS